MRFAPNRHRGFTLIELMVAVAIVAILAVIAYPSYESFMKKGRRASAQSFLMDIAQRQQQYLMDNRSYGSSLSTLSLSTPDDVNQFYTVTIAAANGPPPTFTATATPKGAQTGDPTLTINYQNQKTPAGYW